MATIDYELHEIEDLEDPIFVVAFKGLFDMGAAATGAVDWLSMTHGGKPAASIDPELLFDFQEVRPEVRLGRTGSREILWPSNNVVWAKTDDGTPDLVLLSGVEPNLRWRSFCTTLHMIAEHTQATMVVSMGASLAMAHHSRAFPVKASTGSRELSDRFGIAKPSYEGPTGLIGSLHEHLADNDVPAISLSVSVPHYVPSSPSPKATAALLALFERYFEVPTGHAGLADEIRDWESRVNRALEDDEDVRAYVTDLERRNDDAPQVVVDASDVTIKIEDFFQDSPEDDQN